MRILTKMALVALFLSLGCKPQAKPVEVEEKFVCEQPPSAVDRFQMVGFIKKMNPQIESRDANFIADALISKSQEYGIDVMRFAAIIAQESHFRLNLRACYDLVDKDGNARSQCDIGLGQISPTWVREWKLDKNRLQYDIYYNLDVSARILKHYQDTFPNDPKSYSRYFNANPGPRKGYENLVNKRYKVMENIIKPPVLLARS